MPALEMFFLQMPTLPADASVVGFLAYALWNEVRHRRKNVNGDGNGSIGMVEMVKGVNDKLAALALQNSGIIVRLDVHESRVGYQERWRHWVSTPLTLVFHKMDIKVEPPPQ